MSSTDPIAAKLQSELYAPQQQGLSASYYGALAQAEMAKQQALQAQWQWQQQQAQQQQQLDWEKQKWQQQQVDKKHEEEMHNSSMQSGVGPAAEATAMRIQQQTAQHLANQKPLPLAQMPMQWMQPAWPNNQSVVQGTMNPVSNYPGPSQSMLGYGMPQQQVPQAQQPWGPMNGAMAGSGHQQQAAPKKPWSQEQVERNTSPLNYWR
jgi:hypothetical protein